MKSSEIARKYWFSEYEVNQLIKEKATFPFKENLWGDIIIPDDINVREFFEPLFAKKELEEQKEAEEKLRLEQEEQKKRQEEQQRYLEEQIRLQKEYDRQEKIRQEKEEFERKQREEQFRLRIEKLKSQNCDGYYEYKVISLSDVSGLFKKNSGRVDTTAMTETLNELGIDGWHLVTAYSNELGKNSLSGGAGGALLGINSTVDENILIFERFVKI